MKPNRQWSLLSLIFRAIASGIAFHVAWGNEIWNWGSIAVSLCLAAILAADAYEIDCLEIDMQDLRDRILQLETERVVKKYWN